MSDNVAAIADALDNPTRAPDMAEPGDPGPFFEGGKGERPPFPPGSPVQPLGVSSGLDGSQKCYYLDRLGQIVGLEAGNRHGKNSLIHLFGMDSWWLEEKFPQWSAPTFEGRGKDRVMVKAPEIVGFDQAEASRALIEECVRRGIFDPAGRLRGRGAHALPGGGLLLHLGDTLLVLRAKSKGGLREPEWADTGLFDRFVYPAASPIPRPWHQSTSLKPVTDLIALLRTWNWKRPLLDVRLLLGAIGQGFIGGALPWRSNVWITGDKGTGKSSLNGRRGIVPRLYGEALFRTGQTSSAALRQSLRNSTVPVMLDEIEPSADNRKVTEIIELARISSSGDKVHRGGQDHQAHEFTLQSPFWFSSINIPPMEPSDRSRLGILELRPFAANTVAPDFEAINFEDMGRQLQRRMIEQWPVLLETKNAFHAGLAAKGHDSRGCDQFGTLLACAHVLTDDDVPDAEEVELWAEMCAPFKMAEVNDAMSDQEMCLSHLMTSAAQPRGNAERQVIGSLVGEAVARALNPDQMVPHDRDWIEQLGLKIVNAKWNAEKGKWGVERYMPHESPGYLAIANSHVALNEIFKGTKWQGGVYKQTLARVPGAIDVAAVKMARQAYRATLIPLHEILHESELPALCKPDEARAWRARIEQEGAV